MVACVRKGLPPLPRKMALGRHDSPFESTVNQFAACGGVQRPDPAERNTQRVPHTRRRTAEFPNRFRACFRTKLCSTFAHLPPQLPSAAAINHRVCLRIATVARRRHLRRLVVCSARDDTFFACVEEIGGIDVLPFLMPSTHTATSAPRRTRNVSTLLTWTPCRFRGFRGAPSPGFSTRYVWICSSSSQWKRYVRREYQSSILCRVIIPYVRSASPRR